MKSDILKKTIIICTIIVLSIVILVVFLMLRERNLDETEIINKFNSNKSSFEKAIDLLGNERGIYIEKEFGIIKISHKVNGQYKLKRVSLLNYNEYKEIINFMTENHIQSIYKTKDGYIQFTFYCSAIYCQSITKIDNHERYSSSGYGDRLIQKITGNWYYTESD